jgi:O-antigen ligase
MNKADPLTAGATNPQDSMIRPRYAPQPRPLSPSTRFFFYSLAAYTVFPFFKLPAIDLSVSALMALFLGFGVFLGSDISVFRDYGKWVRLGLFIWLGISCSLLANSFMGQGTIDFYNWKLLMNFTYWIMVFILTICVASTPGVLPRVAKILAVMITLVALARWGETIFLGVGLGQKARLLFSSQNSYGITFSTYAPFLLVPLVSRGGTRWLVVLTAIIVWGAVAINGSRGAWVGVGSGVFCFLFLYLRCRPSQIMGIFLIISLSLGIFISLLTVMPKKFLGLAQERMETFSELDRDKSVDTRKLMIQKGWKMFQNSPLVGAGLGSFRKASVWLETDRVDVSQRTLNRRSAHNSYFEWLAETGLVGVIPLGLLFLVLGFQGYNATLYLGRKGELWALAIYTSFLGMSLHLIVLSGLKDTGTWVIYGLVAAMIVTARKQKLADNPPPPSSPGKGHK